MKTFFIKDILYNMYMQKTSDIITLLKKIRTCIERHDIKSLSEILNSETVRTIKETYPYDRFSDLFPFEIYDYLEPINPETSLTKTELVDTIDTYIAELTEKLNQGNIYLEPSPAKCSLYFDSFTKHDNSISDYQYFSLVKKLEFMSSDELKDFYQKIIGTTPTLLTDSAHMEMVFMCLNDIALQTLKDTLLSE